jgi:outer membrane protein OmpA-like peptidoglycan-associated protein
MNLGYDVVRRAVGTGSLVRLLTSLAAVGLITSCTAVPDWANPVDWYDSAMSDSTPRPVQLETEDEADEDKPFPNLGSVPERPQDGDTDERQRVAEGLVADRDKARYTDETLRAEGTEAMAEQAPQPPAEATPPAAMNEQPTTPLPAVRSLPPSASEEVAKNRTAFDSSPTPMIAAMTRQRQQGGSGEVPLLSAGQGQGQSQTQSRSDYVPPPPASSTTPPEPTERAAPAPAPEIPAPAQPRQQSQAQAPAPNPVTQPTYPDRQPPRASSGNILGDTFTSRLQDSASTVTTAPPNERFRGSNQAYTPSEQTTAMAPMPNQSPLDLPSLEPLVGGSRQVATIQFPDGSANVNGAGRSALQEVVSEYKKRPGMLRVVGHASSRTRDLSISQHKLVNFDISLKRAQSVATQLTRMGVKSEDILIEARGDSEPLYFEAMPRGEAENRRVEIFLEY